MNMKNINLRAIYKNKTQVMYIFSALFSILYTIFVYIFFRSFFIDSIEKIQSARIDTALWAIFALVVLFPIIEEITDRLIIWYVIEKYNGTYWENIYSTMEGPNALAKFDKLKELDNEVTKETLQEFEKKFEK